MLETFIVSQIFAFIIIFCRIGAGLMVLPGFGETYVPQYIRLSFALGVSFLLTPFLAHVIPPFPSSPYALALLILSELLTGIFIGTVCTIIMSATHTAGMIFSFQSGLSSAVIFDSTQNTQGSLLGNFMGLVAIVLLFTTGLDQLMLRGVTDSYTIFAPGKFPPLRDFVETATRMVSDTFTMAVQISAPLIVVGTLLFLGAGILGRLMPTMQVFFLIQAPQLLISFFIIVAVFSGMMLWYLDYFHDKLTGFMAYVH